MVASHFGVLYEDLEPGPPEPSLEAGLTGAPVGSFSRALMIRLPLGAAAQAC